MVFADSPHVTTGGIHSRLATLAAAMLVVILFRYMAVFSMARSMKARLPAYGVSPRISNVTLVFFTHYYLQAQMTWLAKWQKTGQVEPAVQGAGAWVASATVCLVTFVAAWLFHPLAFLHIRWL
ncbi:hypothetical protein [Luteibacter yeojuensis]|uniref:Uncharacterized protein n=1 Tax=Luteibacter yeojuensis TaxID=345309 RepID=A0A0F3KYT9_9GAMM|nr:hypothetical protein [Luteibacter yeojuensis]KJV36450.1 hypothetical protein VI08_04840 [Luteibacter yeojuensis]